MPDVCEDCRWFIPNGHGERDAKGECRAHAPVASLKTTVFPLIHDEKQIACGDFKPRPTP